LVSEIKVQFEGNLTKRFYVFNGLLGLNLSWLFVWNRRFRLLCPSEDFF